MEAKILVQVNTPYEWLFNQDKLELIVLDMIVQLEAEYGTSKGFFTFTMHKED